jgi:hypothetical protein
LHSLSSLAQAQFTNVGFDAILQGSGFNFSFAGALLNHTPFLAVLRYFSDACWLINICLVLERAG